MSGGVSNRLRKNDDGAVMVEFALILPILLMLLVGIFEFGQAYSAKVSINGAAREGARCLALKEVGCDADDAVNANRGLANITSIAKTGCPASSNPSSTSYATVTISATFTFAIPFVNLGTRTMTATGSMRCGL